MPTKEDNFPLVIPEAFASGTLILASDVGGIKEILSKIDSQLLIENTMPHWLSQKINYFLYLNPLKYNSIVYKGSQFVLKNLAPENTTKTLINTLNDLDKSRT